MVRPRKRTSRSRCHLVVVTTAAVDKVCSQDPDQLLYHLYQSNMPGSHLPGWTKGVVVSTFRVYWPLWDPENFQLGRTSAEVTFFHEGPSHLLYLGSQTSIGEPTKLYFFSFSPRLAIGTLALAPLVSSSVSGWLKGLCAEEYSTIPAFFILDPSLSADFHPPAAHGSTCQVLWLGRGFCYSLDILFFLKPKRLHFTWLYLALMWVCVKRPLLHLFPYSYIFAFLNGTKDWPRIFLFFTLSVIDCFKF